MLGQRDGGGSAVPRARRYSVRRLPAMVHRSPPIRNGGIDSRLTRMPRYVVPQMRHTAIHAKYAIRRCRAVVVSLTRRLRRPTGSVGDGSASRFRERWRPTLCGTSAPPMIISEFEAYAGGKTEGGRARSWRADPHRGAGSSLQARDACGGSVRSAPSAVPECLDFDFFCPRCVPFSYGRAHGTDESV